MANGLERQFQQFLQAPGTSVADRQAAEKWLRFATANEERTVNSWMAENRTKNAAKRRDLLERVTDLQCELADVKRDADQGLRPVAELLKARRLAEQHLRNFEGVYESLENTEAHIAVVAGDPVAYMDSLHDKYHGLRDRRPNLASYLAKHPADRPF